ncbi:MAG TPA: Mur ligase family protein [Symbiobacteriaceae bacterium]|jgi:UDP-N-acetylmuramyl tripeptide synthase|nr:Mur ligase family protein [Symbiobacteriaceae bacterium]
MNIRQLMSVWTGKGVVTATRLLGRGGTTLPGTVARKIAPDVLEALSRQPRQGVLSVTGTNGKTTTAKMLSAMFEAAGQQVTHNRAGANLISGLTTAFLQSASWTGRVGGSVGLMETDEATMPRACQEIRPRAAVVTNFFRDQLDRYGELEHTVNFVGRGLAHLAKGGKAALNADDPLCASLGRREGVTPFYYGIEDESVGTAEMNQTADAKHCVVCGTEYDYKVFYYAHLGKYRCPKCGNERPQPQVYVDRIWNVDARGSNMRVVTPGGDFEARLQIPGLYNVYNALAAVAGALAMGLPLDAIKQGLETTTSQFGRMELIPMKDRDVYMALVKNPVGFNSVIHTVMQTNARKNLVIAINDLYADGTDISWLWDVDFEALADRQDEVNFIVCSGLRAEDMAVRLKYAGVDPAKLKLEKDLGQALETGLGQIEPGELLYVMPTYTAMLQMREIIQKQGYTKKFWEV